MGQRNYTPKVKMLTVMLVVIKVIVEKLNCN